MAADTPRPSRALPVGAIVSAAAILTGSLAPLTLLWGLAAPAYLPLALLTLALSLAVSPTQDWDLMTVPLLPALLLLAATAARALHAQPGRIRAAWLALALAPTLGFVLVRASITSARSSSRRDGTARRSRCSGGSWR